MNSVFNILGYDSISKYDNKITTTLSRYIEKTITKNGLVNYKEVKTRYFLENDKWNIDFLKNIPQFETQVEDYKCRQKKRTNIYFSCNNSNINKELKFIVYSKIFSDKWGITALFTGQIELMIRLVDFINEKYPDLNSLLYINLEKANIQWIDWLNDKNIALKRRDSKTSKLIGKDCYCKTPIVNLLKNYYISLCNLIDERDEWEKDTWDVRNLKKYGVTYNKSGAHYCIDFDKINNIKIKNEVKRYIKQRLVSSNKFSWSTGLNYMNYLSNFLNFICELEPTWNDLKGLERHHIEKFLEWLNIYAQENLNQKNSNPKLYIGTTLKYIKQFLSCIQDLEYEIAPIKNVRKLILSSDKPTVKKKPNDQIDYVPNIILEQLFENINNLNKEVVPIIWTMYKTGLRISDTLKLKQNCLIKLNNKFWIEADIEKTYVEGHRIPIDDELSKMLAVLIKNAKENSNQDNNPETYIFVRYKGSRKGNPYSQGWVQNILNLFAMDYNITDELGNVYHFKNHAFRHTYAIKMLNGGADILTVQELLAHASPEMSMRYARLLDDTKRKVFDNAVKQGIFSFDESAKLKEENNGKMPTDVLDMLWTNHKLNAIDTPYGTCLQRTNGKCQFAKQPPCLTCNRGNPCKDLCIGAFEGDIQKYEILINSIKSMIESAKVYNRKEMAKENEELLNLYENIHSKIIEGNIIYSRLDRLKKTGDVNA